VTLDIVLTEDGSLTCADTESGELYHNRAGAYTEALQHYVQACDLLSYIKKQAGVSILDSCFGLGYNSFVFLDYLLRHLSEVKTSAQNFSCQIIGIDKDRNILNVIQNVLAQKQFALLREELELEPKTISQMIANWQSLGSHEFKLLKPIPMSITIELKFTDLLQEVQALVALEQKFDYIFHDGFSPRAMPELWTVDLFKQYVKLMADNGRIITYSSAGAVRGALKECGLEVRKSGPLGGKSGGTVAFKNEQLEIVDDESIFFLGQEENDRLSTRSGIPYRDPNLNGAKADIIKRRNDEIKESKLSAYKESLDAN